jgi:hypothetical protein
MHRAGAALIGHLLTERGSHTAQVCCVCGADARYHDHRPKRIVTALGAVEFERAYWSASPKAAHNKTSTAICAPATVWGGHINGYRQVPYEPSRLTTFPPQPFSPATRDGCGPRA